MSALSRVPAVFSELFSGDRLRARSLRATGFTLFKAGAFKFLQLASNLILTRILFPEAFGMIALATVFIGGLSMISDVGIRPSIIRSKRADEAVFQSTAWTLQIVRGGILVLIAWALAWPYAMLYDQPVLAPLICVMALSTGIAGFESIILALRERNLTIGYIVLLHIGTKVVAVILTVLLAWWLQSVWALAFGAVLGALIKVIASHALFPSVNHRLKWDKSVLSEILTYGRWVLLGTLLTYVGGQGLQAVQGLLVDIETLAFLAIATQFSWMIGEIAVAVLRGVAFPVLSHVQRERPAELRRTVGRIHGLQLLGTIPAFLALSVIAEPMINLLYDDRYSSAGPYLALLALNAAFVMVSTVYQNALLATGDSRTYSFIMGAFVAIRILGTFIGFEFGGIMGMIVGLGVSALVVTGISMAVAIRGGIAHLKIDIGVIILIIAAYWIQMERLL